ncbi:hypothetical protein ACUXV3_17625 [Roseobacteraceae bacterium NS-SX3]
MLLLGVGLAYVLTRYGIDFAADISDAGKNIQDHYSQNAVQCRLKDPSALFD